MTKMVNLFISHLLEFFDDLVTVFPHDGDIKRMRRFLRTYSKINPKSIVVGWKYYVTDKYKKIILDNSSNDIIDIICNKDFGEDIADVDKEDEGAVKQFIEDMRAPILKMNDRNKEKAIKYLTNLVKISELV